ncbi:MAG: DUF4829 domain-containing protein [Psychroflexus sp.]|jgi:hypothetical protein|nr:DUF4829 domain-containing protein [Psychroflexus sp.]MDR9447864.1 DUF4829 domain-containing protein [Psychroflexus sp.]
MKIILLPICFLVFINSSSQKAENTVNAFFKALNTKDVETLNHLTLDDMQLHSLTLDEDATLTSSTKIKFINSIKSIPSNVNIEERISDIKTLKSDYLIQFQVPYEFYIDGILSHKGTNVLTLVNTTNGWRISYIADTREKSNR